jgi:hypothetical protein
MSFYMHANSKIPASIGDVNMLFEEGYMCMAFDSWKPFPSDEELNDRISSTDMKKTFPYDIESWRSGVGIKKRFEALSSAFPGRLGSLFGKMADSVASESDQQSVVVIRTEDFLSENS